MKAPAFLALACALLAGAPSWAAPAAPAAAPVAVPEAQARLVKAADGRLLAPDIARIVNRNELVVAMLAKDNPPFFSVKKGVLVGTDVDMARRVANELGVGLRFDRSPATFDGVAEAVAAGRADLGISRLARTLRRGQYVHFSNTYMRLGHALLINRVKFAAMAGDRPLQQVIRNFDGKLGVLANSSWEEFGRRNFPRAQLVRFATWEQAVAAARSGAVVAAYRDELEVQQIVRNEPGLALSLRTVTFDDLESPLAMMVGIGDPTLLSFVNEVIAQWVDKPTVSSVLKAIK
ncbi:amino acid ABC transporter substrate-binding protein [Massilia forsythiae]|uniref:Amino acid ABC transporter substrate-binding protein n=1 Tax=Massilia forsythiae TaxID=2728020 RepID=A0A7Z2VY29_9BURK|nr:ABC transporter substrate-binding protein [Massilia forsythiae]QJE01568.1 amino acid ABC transporter substrate-binding protein [Massilia forsythiae]